MTPEYDRLLDVFEDDTRALSDALRRKDFLESNLSRKNITAWDAHIIWRRIYHTSFTPFKVSK